MSIVDLEASSSKTNGWQTDQFAADISPASLSLSLSLYLSLSLSLSLSIYILRVTKNIFTSIINN